jgi:hypothetical protein
MGRCIFVAMEGDDAVGKKLVGTHYTPGDLDDTDVTRPLWRYLDLSLTKPDGSTAKLQLARPMWWIESAGAKPGATFDLSLLEAGIEGKALVLAVRPCDADSREGDSKYGLVIGTIEHQNAVVFTLTFDNDTAHSLGVTATHPIYSLDRDDFAPAGDLKLRERVLTLGGELTLTSKVEQPNRQTVYNLEVHRDHVYHVSQDGILAHNTGLDCLMAVKKAINSDIVHAVEQAVNKGIVSGSEKHIIENELRELSKAITKARSFPVGTVRDPGNILPRLDSVLVPLERGGAAVYEVGKNGTARLRTLLNAEEFAKAIEKLVK